MKKVITHGNKSKTFIYIRKCNACKCEFEFDRLDVDNTFYDQREGYEVWYVACPECNDKTGIEKPKPSRYNE